ncbi:hypothetical protein BDD43_3411 [Mucilaginibacter gracilis]|uniref:Uncharacterized protein n=1 Tax=Mucilaginibacter gracilis TaxID=423350 RepID=A0A495J5F1_9SPHI|nr:hypothetical protein [Mucilaginibacter gracilis]RKR83209.1 hypothetical protein BDD43_3411 [Mucilaginibacter gracilis]
MNRYLITSARFDGEMEFRFDADGNLKYFENRAAMTDEMLAYLYKCFPFNLQLLGDLCKSTTTLRMVQVTVQVTFKEFYDAYGYKVGNKGRAEKLFNALTHAERYLAMEGIARYKAWLAAHPRTDMLYPETYLSQRRWENELPK